MDVKRTYRKMTEEDKQFAQGTTLNTLKDELDDGLQKLIDLKSFGNNDAINREEIAIAEVTMVCMQSALQEGQKLIDRLRKDCKRFEGKIPKSKGIDDFY